MKKKLLKTVFITILTVSLTLVFSISSSALSMGSCHVQPSGDVVRANCYMWNQNYNSYTNYRNLQSEISSVYGDQCGICIGAYTARRSDGNYREFWTGLEWTTGTKSITQWISTDDYLDVTYGRGTYRYSNWRVEFKSYWNNGGGTNVAYRQLWQDNTQYPYY
jgi:hypothetical protein